MHTQDSDHRILLIWVCPFGQVTSRILSGLMFCILFFTIYCFLSLLRCFAMSQKRLVADPNLGIMDIQSVILGHWNKYKDFDLLTFLECPGHQKWSWKTAPNVSWMSKTADMISAFLRVAPNGVLQSQKVKGALLKISQSCKINRSRFCDIDWSDKCDLRLRTILAQFRELKKRPDSYLTAMRKASAEEKLAIDSALSLMHLETVEPACEEPKDLHQLVPYSRAPAAASSLALGTTSCKTSKVAPSNPSSSSTMVPTSGKSFSSVFKELLEKDFSSPAKEVVPSQHVPSAPSKPTMQLSRGFARTFSNFNCVPPEDVTSSEGTPQLKKKEEEEQVTTL